MLRLMFQRKNDNSGVSSFQALSMTLAGRVGTGNIAGVATAICFGGPGALFWMWVVAFLGASSAFVESTLGQIYKERINGECTGGPAFYRARCTKQILCLGVCNHYAFSLRRPLPRRSEQRHRRSNGKCLRD